MCLLVFVTMCGAPKHCLWKECHISNFPALNSLWVIPQYCFIHLYVLHLEFFYIHFYFNSIIYRCPLWIPYWSPLLLVHTLHRNAVSDTPDESCKLHCAALVVHLPALQERSLTFVATCFFVGPWLVINEKYNTAIWKWRSHWLSILS